MFRSYMHKIQFTLPDSGEPGFADKFMEEFDRKVREQVEYAQNQMAHDLFCKDPECPHRRPSFDGCDECGQPFNSDGRLEQLRDAVRRVIAAERPLAMTVPELDELDAIEGPRQLEEYKFAWEGLVELVLAEPDRSGEF